MARTAPLDTARASRIRWIFLALTLAVGLATALAARPADAASLKASAEELTKDLINLHSQTPRLGLFEPSAGQPADAELTKKLLRVAQRRQAMLARLVEDDPKAVLALVLPRAVRAGLPAAVRAHIEEEVQLEGQLEILHADYKGGGGRYLYFLRDRDKRFSLHFAARPLKRSLTGDRVRVTGVRVDQALALGAGDTAVKTLAAAPTPGTMGAQRTAVFLVNFENNPAQPFTRAFAENVVFNLTSNFFRENSSQQTWLTGDVFGWYTSTVSGSTCDYIGLLLDAHTAARAADVDLHAYDRFVYVFPRNGCPWLGLGTVGGSPSYAWINGDLTLSVVGHELGHGLGLFHSHALECGTVTIGPSCARVEYGDTLDIMGGDAGHLNAFQKELLGWLDYAQSPPITTVTSSGTYTIDAYESSGSHPKALKIPVGLAEWLYVEYRQPIGFDGFLAGNWNVVNGVVLHYGSSLDRDSSYLLDLTPSTDTWWDPALGIGQSFSSPFFGVTVRALSANGQRATVSVNLGSDPCVRANPTVTVSPPVHSAAAGADVSFTTSVTNNDSPACPPSLFIPTAAVPAGWTPAFAAPTLTIDPGGTGSTLFRVTSPASAAGGSYALAATVTNSVAPAYSGSASATYIVTATSGVGKTFADSFDRPDSPLLGNGWLAGAGDLKIEKNELRNAATRGLYRAVVPAVSGATQTASARFASGDNNGAPRFGLILRYQDDKNYYVAYRQAGGTSVLRIAKVVNGVETVLKSAAAPNPHRNVFTRLHASANGTTLTVALEGGKPLSVNDGTFSGGSVGILLGSTATAASLVKSHRADDFSASAQ